MRHRRGDVLARRYRLIEPIGEGGMGSVWRARSLGLEVDVALKLIRPGTDMPHAAERLLKEARAAARVVHPAAVRVFDFSLTEAGEPFLVMELLRGKSLSTLLAAAGPMSTTDTVRMLLPVIDALAAAHREGIVHRDVKPSNIMLVRECGRVIPKLIDFGIAAVVEGLWSQQLTLEGMLVGSPVYMAPEQLRAPREVPDERTDIWGMCVTFCELASGQRPFDGPTALEAAVKILGAEPARPDRFAAEPDLWRLVERGLSKSPAGRWPSVIDLGRALAAWAAARGVACDAAGQSLSACWLNAQRRSA